MMKLVELPAPGRIRRPATRVCANAAQATDSAALVLQLRGRAGEYCRAIMPVASAESKPLPETSRGF